MRLSKKIMIRVITFILVLLWCSIPVYAHQAVVPGSGGGPSVPLYMRDSTIKDGDTDVPVNTEIVLYYSHNVADQAIQETNRKEISLKESSGESVEFEISFPTVFAYRQEVWILPKSLKPDTIYVIMVSENFMSRNGYTTGKTDTITFTTESAEEAAQDKGTTDDGSLSKEDELMKQAKESGIVIETQEKPIQRVSDAKTGRQEESDKTRAFVIIIPAGAVAITVAVLLITSKRRKKKKQGDTT